MEKAKITENKREENYVYDGEAFADEIPGKFSYACFWETVDEIRKGTDCQTISLQVYGKRESLRYIRCINPKKMDDLETAEHLKQKWIEYGEMFQTNRTIIWRLTDPKWINK